MKKIIVLALVLVGQTALADAPNKYAKELELREAQAYNRRIKYIAEEVNQALRESNKLVNSLEDELTAMKRTDKHGIATQQTSEDFYGSIDKPFEYKPQAARTGIRYVGVSR